MEQFRFAREKVAFFHVVDQSDIPFARFENTAAPVKGTGTGTAVESEVQVVNMLSYQG